MFDFNNVLNNSDSTINSIQQNLLDIRIAFFNCHKLFINVEKTDNDNEYRITNIVEENKININYNEVIVYKCFEFVLLNEFRCIALRNINKCIEQLYISKYFKICTKRNFNEVYPSKVLIKYNNSDDIQDLINIFDINDYNNAFNDINRPGCLDVTTYNRFFDLLPNPLYKIGDNVLEPKFHKFYITSIYNKQKEPIFYMDKSNKKFYFIFSHKTLMKLETLEIVQILRCNSAYNFIYNKLYKYNHKHYRSICKMNNNKNISITISHNSNDVPEYILKMAWGYLNLSYIIQHHWVIIMVEPY